MHPKKHVGSMTDLEILLTKEVSILKAKVGAMKKISEVDNNIISSQESQINKLKELLAIKERISVATHNLMQNLR